MGMGRRVLLATAALVGVLGLGYLVVRLDAPQGKHAENPPVPEPPAAVPVSNALDGVSAAVPKADAATNAVETPRAVASEVREPPPTAAARRKPVLADPKVPKNRQVLLANRRIVVAEGRSFPKRFCAAQSPTVRGTAPYVVISEFPVSRDVRIQAVSDGARVIGFLPNNALLVEADAQALKHMEEDVFFAAAVEYEPSDKIQRALLDAQGETVEATVVLLNPKDRDRVVKFIVDGGGTLLRDRSTERSVGATLSRELVGELAGKAEVKWVERRARMKVFNDVAVRPGLMNVTPVREAPPGLTGAGQIITTSDTGIDTGVLASLHPDLTNAVIGLEAVWEDCHADDRDGHGTHTAGSIVGDGSMSGGQIRGVAYGAKLWAWGMCDEAGDLWLPSDMADLFRPYDLAANIHSASWGVDDAEVAAYGGEYIDLCRDIDAYVWSHPDFLPVFAAGNAGYRRSSSSVMPPATSKNILSVGASKSSRYGDDPTEIADFSSCGPCQDGRVKPDVAAPGTSIRSTRTVASGESESGLDRHYRYMSGTSMATPLTAGSAALVREWLGTHRLMTNATAALVKAVMTGGANGGVAPDDTFGWGRVDLAESIVPTNGLGVFLADRLPFGARSNFTFRVTTTNVAPLCVQLAWVDYPGEPAAAKALVNDLDLCVSTNGRTWLGNGGTAADDVNNVECVRIRTAEAASYLVRVRCTAIVHDSSEGGAAALYVRGAFDAKDVECDARAGLILTMQ